MYIGCSCETRLLMSEGNLSAWTYSCTEYTLAKGYNLAKPEVIGDEWRAFLSSEMVRLGYIAFQSVKPFSPKKKWE